MAAAAGAKSADGRPEKGDKRRAGHALISASRCAAPQEAVYQ